LPKETNDSGDLLQQALDLATGEVHEIGEHVKGIDECLRGKLGGETLGLIGRVTALETSCRRNHNGGSQSAASPSRQVVWTVDKVIYAVAAGLALILGAIGTLTSQCNRVEVRRSTNRWHRQAQIDSLEGKPRGDTIP
jgi:hypothetical protein